MYWMYWGEGAIHVATSADLIHWTPVEDQSGEPVELLRPRPGHFDSSFPETGPPPVLTSAGIVVLYNGKNAAERRRPGAGTECLRGGRGAVRRDQSDASADADRGAGAEAGAALREDGAVCGGHDVCRGAGLVPQASGSFTTAAQIRWWLWRPLPRRRPRSPHRLPLPIQYRRLFHRKCGGLPRATSISTTETRLSSTATASPNRISTTSVVELYTVTRFPSMRVRFFGAGVGGDRVTGGGGGPIDQRLERDVFSEKPSVVTVMLGMNDGRYRATTDEIESAYLKGYEHLLDSLRTNAPSARVTLLGPSPYDDVTRAPFFAGGYNAVMQHFGVLDRALAQKYGAQFVDLNPGVVTALQKAEALDPRIAQLMLPDRVHPECARALGHGRAAAQRMERACALCRR